MLKDDIYEKLYLEYNIEKGNKEEVLSNLWAETYNNMDISLKLQLLDKLIQENVRTWEFISVLNKFFEKINPEDPEHFALWLIKMSKFVKDDLANGKFYGSIENLVKYHTTFCIEILRYCSLENINEDIEIIYSLILGNLRKYKPAITKEIDNKLKMSKNKNILYIYYISFVYSIKSNNKKIKIFFEEIRNNPCVDYNKTVFYVASKLGSMYITNKETIKYILDWLVQNTLDLIEPGAQLYVLRFIRNVLYNYDLYNKEISQILKNFGAIKKENFGIWREFEYTIVKLLNIEEFSGIIKTIINKNGNTFIEIIEKLDYFQDEFLKTNNQKLYTSLLFSKKIFERNFIEAIYSNDLKAEPKFNNDMLAKLDFRIIKIVFLEMVLYCHNPKRLGKFFCLLNDIYDNFPDIPFKTVMFNEILYSSINFTSGCYSEIVKHNNKCKLLDNIVKECRKYNNILTKSKNSPANSFLFPNSYEISIKSKEETNIKIQTESFKKSVFSNLFGPPVVLIYGNQHAFLTNEGLSESRDYGTIETSVEIPKISIINPYNEYFKKINFIKNIYKIQSELDNE